MVKNVMVKISFLGYVNGKRKREERMNPPCSVSHILLPECASLGLYDWAGQDKN